MMWIESMHVTNLVDYDVAEIPHINTDKVSPDNLAEKISTLMWTKWRHPTFVALVEGDWTDDTIDIELDDTHTGKSWQVTVYLQPHELLEVVIR